MIRKQRDFPSVEELLQNTELSTEIAMIPRPLAVELVREAISVGKERLRTGKSEIATGTLLNNIRTAILQAKRREITRVINATGVVVHTNLGRAPLSKSLFEAVIRTVTGYGNIEYDLTKGSRGNRGVACEKYLSLMAGSESATVVNNNAAALFLILNSLANRKQAIVSRGELVQIGGGFRIPDILKRSGSRLCEVGTTNITKLSDYEDNVNDRTGIILKVHKSNFVQAGFTEEVPLRELVNLGKRYDVFVVNDLGSGVFVPTRDILGLAEPMVQQSVRTGADLTCFSGDKMLGGVQAGLIVGRHDLVKKIKRNPLFRTMRVDKIVFSILEKLLTIYLNGDYLSEVRLWQILSIPEAKLYQRGKAIVKTLGNPPMLSVAATMAYTGGGALPEVEIPSIGIVFESEYKATKLMRKFRQLETPVIGRIDDDHFVLDLKAVAEDDIDLLRESIRKVIC
ncbi:MAG: L-seryl-tRNA(Sec) selenium transferase [candidate division Zixibacteria bacterium]|nr:L-seryl-tRNA(Sec) selenium transferase [candidate division Zixibacteria bacterium]